MNIMGFRSQKYYVSIAILIVLIGTSLVPATFAEAADPAQVDSDPVIAAAGDIACDPGSASFNGGEGNPTSCRQKYTSDLLMDPNLAAVLPLGDVQYECGGYQAFLQSYEHSWGRVKSISHPVVGNHEYLTSGGTDCTDQNQGAAGYFKYFGSAAGEPSKGYYSFDIGAWHLIALNSNCEDAGGCSYGSPQVKWLQADLVAHRNLCTLVYWHIPLFSSGGRTAENTQSIWQILYGQDVDVILNGHDHIYERFAPQTPEGTLDTVRGIRQFVVGTGGSNLTEIETIAPNSEVRNNTTYGVLKLTLHSDSYDWVFVPEAGQTFTDSGTDKCHGNAPVNTPEVAATQTTVPLQTQEAVFAPATTAFSFKPIADAYISKTKPAANFGASNLLRLFGGPIGDSYMRFDVQGVPGRVARATLRLYSYTPSNTGFQVHALTQNDWKESSITYETAPPVGDLIAVSEPFNAKQWTSVDLTPLVKGDGTYDIVLLTFNRDPLSFASRNAIPRYQPQLVVDVLTNSIPAQTATSVPPTQPFISTESPE